MTGLAEVLAAIALVLGGALTFIAALGVLRMPDVYIRMHASTKAGTLGVLLIALALVFVGADAGVVSKAVAVFAFILLTAPIGAHLIARAAWRGGLKPWQWRPERTDPPTDGADRSRIP
ncbi:monovalent cation/H(+) antiporter subunit G [Thiohalocapsa sp.]|jgi:multicomponent Na+:H+ antiporter subunit G|uniref:monovalent cation/H(+) antiporter subunit G n=1 Tax=Thiohalocapsa sp. TaxID=2497641 RepID=UPI0025DE9D73|nr:monovalent cation/H(+) antiporter subunit G [Thiohalocapsa sp.]